MIFEERDEGDYHIYGGALEARQGDGFTAAVVVSHVRNINRAHREIFRDDNLACGHRWRTRSAALSYAMGKGREVVSKLQHRLVS